MATSVYNYLASEVVCEPIAQFYQQFEREAQKKYSICSISYLYIIYHMICICSSA